MSKQSGNEEQRPCGWEMHTKYRQNILCDFDDNEAVFRRCCAIMNLEILPQVRPRPFCHKVDNARGCLPRRRRERRRWVLLSTLPAFIHAVMTSHLVPSFTSAPSYP